MKESNNDFFVGEDNLDNYISTMFKKFINVVKSSKQLSDDTDEFDYQLKVDDKFKKQINETSRKLLNCVSNFHNYTDDGNERFRNGDVTEKYDNTVDLLDKYYENIHTECDKIQKEKPVKKFEKKIASTLKKFVRPQQNWTDIDNSNGVFIPKVSKNILNSLQRDDEDCGKKFGFGAGSGGAITKNTFEHPFRDKNFKFAKAIKNLPGVKNKHEERLFSNMNHCKCTWIDNRSQLLILKKELEKQKEIAIDLESHSYRSFQGFVCLMQVSTRTEDFLIDCQQIREDVNLLSDCFLDPNITKVLHGSENDVLWLQRDFGLYLVNLFDTGQAARVLGYPSFSFAYLLKYFCDKTADKKYQSADWRVRPLPSEMVKYAREDTHYLLYIYDRLRNILLERSNTTSLYETVLLRSNQLCMSRYEKVQLTDTSYSTLFSKLRLSSVFNKTQENVFRGLYHWRDRVARREDESVGYVLPKHMLTAISQNLPTTRTNLFNCCAPVPPLLRKKYKEVLNVMANSARGIFEEVNPKFGSNLSLKDTCNASINDRFDMDVIQPEQQNDHKTPTLSTEELYNTVGWIENEEDMDSSENGLFHSSKVDDIKQSFVSSLFAYDSKFVPKSQYGEIEKIKSSFSFESMFGNYGQNGKEDHVDSKLDVNKRIFSSDQPSTPLKKNIIINTKSRVMEIPPEERVPKSLGEIYKLSQENRKKNKKKKQTKSESSKGDKMEDFKKSVSKLPEKPVDFMRKIGWIQSSVRIEETPENEVKTKARRKGDFNGSRGGGSRKKNSKKNKGKKNYSTYPGKAGKNKWSYKKN